MLLINRFIAKAALTAVLVAGAAFMAPTAKAVTLLYTIDSAYQGPAGYTVNNSGGIGESIALPFSSAAAATITDITAFIGAATGSVTLGIMPDFSGLPSGAFLDYQTVALSTGSPVVLSSLSWLIAGSTPYWLVAIATNGTLAGWNVSGFLGPFAKTSSVGSINVWQSANGNLTQASINATIDETPPPRETPLPATLPLFASGLGAIGFIGWRKKRKASRAA